MHKYPAQYLGMIAAHLNAPYGHPVSPNDIATALRSGSFASLQIDDWIKELIASMFVEMAPEYIARASFEAGVRLEEADALYQHARSDWGCLASSDGKKH